MPRVARTGRTPTIAAHLKPCRRNWATRVIWRSSENTRLQTDVMTLQQQLAVLRQAEARPARTKAAAPARIAAARPAVTRPSRTPGTSRKASAAPATASKTAGRRKRG
ncbi:hypothetical protein [Paraburkholderia sp. GAS32]|uniref:hypothetical protein n=1 Tax=Paraburkholderia sp. GAS32 TaxID=3035129 RepID=UPI003D2354EE